MSLTKAKINSKNVKKHEHKTKLIIYIITLNKVIKNYNSY